jgi:hypothetical protein
MRPYTVRFRIILLGFAIVAAFFIALHFTRTRAEANYRNTVLTARIESPTFASDLRWRSHRPHSSQ